jgi:hypothetical protein
MAYCSAFAQNVSYYEELRNILSSFQCSGIQVIVLKGAALAEMLYPDISLRPFGDIDLLVRERDLEEAENRLLLMGYESTTEERRQGYGRRSREHSTYLKDESHPLYVELHTRLFPFACDLQSEVDGLWARAVAARIGGVSSLVLSTEDTVLYLCAHAFRHGLPIRLLWLYDLAQTIVKHGESLNWKLMEERAEAFGVHRITGFVLDEVRQTFDVSLPRRATSWPESCELSGLEKLLLVNESGSVIWYYILRLRSAKFMEDGLRFTIERIFPSRDYIMWRYSISNPKLALFGYFYRFYHSCLYILKAVQTMFTFKLFSKKLEQKSRCKVKD